VIGLALTIAVVAVLAYAAGRWAHRTTDGLDPHEAWDNGFQHGVRTAHHLVRTYPKPYINFGEERGWDLARHQLTSELGHLLAEALPDETHPTATGAAARGVSAR
jgi:hypothetical protein